MKNRIQPTPEYFRGELRKGLITLFLLLCFFSGITGSQALWARNDAVEFFNQDRFHEKVSALNEIPIGATEAEVIRTVGEPVEKKEISGGSKIFIYRLRLYKGPEPFSKWPRHVYLSSETRIVFDKHGRVTSNYREP